MAISNNFSLASLDAQRSFDQMQELQKEIGKRYIKLMELMEMIENHYQELIHSMIIYSLLQPLLPLEKDQR